MLMRNEWGKQTEINDDNGTNTKKRKKSKLYKKLKKIMIKKKQ